MAGSLFVNSLIFQITICLVLFSQTSSYEELKLENAKICKIREDADDSIIKLGKEKSSSKIITQETYFASWSGRYNFICSFQVRAPAEYGVYAVIQVLNFRRNESTKECKDYVRFEAGSKNFFFSNWNSGKKIRGESFCGRIYAGQSNEDEIEDGEKISPNSFIAPEGAITVTIYVATERLLMNEKLDLKIAFTAYKNTCQSKKEHYIKCNTCEWIWEGLYDDMIQNCPYSNCRDEKSCTDLAAPYVPQDIVSSGTGTKVTVGAVATIIILFLMFATCLWGCRRSQRCCWSPAVANPSRIELNRTREPDENGTSFGDLPPGSTTPSAPPISELKDLPPSYDSLFPAK